MGLKAPEKSTKKPPEGMKPFVSGDGDITGKPPPNDLKTLNALSDKVEKAQIRRTPTSPVNKGRGTAIGLAYRLSMELVVGIVVGGYIGWWLDGFFNTAPLFLLIMLILGMAAGVVNLLRTSREMNERMGLTQEEDEDEPK